MTDEYNEVFLRLLRAPRFVYRQIILKEVISWIVLIRKFYICYKKMQDTR